MSEKTPSQARKVKTELENLTISKFIKTERTDSTIKSIDNLWNGHYIITVEEWLQRCAQEKAWTRNNHQKSQSFMNGLIVESDSNTQSMSLVRADAIVKLLEDIIKQGTSEYVNIAELVLGKILKAVKKVGNIEKLKICIDGQNRSLYAIGNFYKCLYPINITFTEDPKKSGSYYYDELPSKVQDQIDNIIVQVDIIHTVDIEKVLDRVVAMNEGEPWNNTERRSISFTPVSFIINQLAADPIVSWFFKQLLDKPKEHGIKGVSGDYYRYKKGDVLMLSELLHYTLHYHFGSSRQLDDLYKSKIENGRTTSFKEIVIFIANTFHDNKELLKDIKILSMIKDLFICTRILTQERGPQSGAMFGASKVMSLSNIKDKSAYIKALLKPMISLYLDKNDRIPLQKSNATTYVPKPGTWAYHHKSQTMQDVKIREEFLVTKQPKILKTAYEYMTKNNIVDSGYERTDIDEISRMQLELEDKQTDYERWKDFTPANVKTVDHTLPVVKGGSNDISNLGLMSKELNSSKNAR